MPYDVIVKGCGGSVCGEKDCPCPLCHGDPQKWLDDCESCHPILGDDGCPTGEIGCDYCGRAN